MEQHATVQPPPPEWLVPDYPPLGGNVGKAAVNGQILYYPKVVRSQSDEPIEGQKRGLISFMILKEPQKTKQGKTIHGFFKLRGNWSDDNQATSRGARIVREQDSKYPVRVAHVGEWLPLIDDDSMAKKQVNINLDGNKEEEDAKQKAVEEEEDKRKRIVREIKEREEEVRNGKDYNDDPKSLDYYTMKMVVWRSLTEAVVLEEKKLKSIKDKLTNVRALLSNLDEELPEHSNYWVPNFNQGRAKAGLPEFVFPESEIELYRATDPRPQGPVASVSNE